MERSNVGGHPLPSDEERTAMRDVESERAVAELDARRERIREEIAQVYESTERGLHEIATGRDLHDDHEVIVGLRRLAALGYLAKMRADELEATLPQPSRLFAPTA